MSDALVSHLDFAPTVLDLADVPIPEGLTPPAPEAPMQNPPWPGKSIKPLLVGESDSVQNSVIIEFDADYIGLRLRTLITLNYHITIYAGQPYGELYDLKSDPDQLHNLWCDTKYKDLKESLQVALLHRLAATDNNLPRRMGHA